MNSEITSQLVPYYHTNLSLDASDDNNSNSVHVWEEAKHKEMLLSWKEYSSTPLYLLHLWCFTGVLFFMNQGRNLCQLKVYDSLKCKTNFIMAVCNICEVYLLTDAKKEYPAWITCVPWKVVNAIPEVEGAPEIHRIEMVFQC